jgi:multidrug efflux pump subunit AcrB
MKGLLAYFAGHRIAANLLMLAVLAMGAFYSPQIKNTLVPDIRFPALEVEIEWPGAGAEAVTVEVVEPLESRLRQVSGIKAIVAHAMFGRASFNLALQDNVEPLAVRQDVQNAIDGLQQLPSGLRPARIRTLVFDELALRIGLGGDARHVLYREALQIRRALMEQGVARVEIDGWSEPRLEVGLSAARVQALGLPLDSLANQLRAQLRSQVAGQLPTGSDWIVVRSASAAAQVETVPGMLVSAANGDSLPVSALAEVRWRESDERITRVNGGDGIVLSLFRSAQTDTLAVAEIVQDWLRDYRRQHPDRQVQLLEDASQTVVANRDMLIGNALMGLVAVFAVLVGVLGARIAFWTAAGVPVVVLGSLLVLMACGYSINLFTVAAFIMVLGVVVDDSIVVGEETERLARLGGDGPHSLQALHQVGPPVIASALTTLVAFVPLLFLPGLLGASIAPIAVVVIAAILFSLFECFFILPAHLRDAKAHAVSQRPPWGARQIDRLQAAMQAPMRAAIARPRATLLSAVGGLAACLLLGALLFDPGELEIDNDSLRNIVFLEPGIPREERLRVVEHLESTLRESIASLHGAPDSLRALTVIERDTLGKPWLETVVSLVPSPEREFSSSELLQAWGQRLQPNSWVRRYGLETQSEKPSTSISWNLSGPLSLEQLQAATAEFSSALAQLPEVLMVEDSFSQGGRQIEFTLKPQGRALGLDEAAIAQQLFAGFEGIELGRVAWAGSEAEVRLLMQPSERRPDRLAQFPIQTSAGTTVPLWSVAELREGRASAHLARIDGQPELTVSAHLWPAHLGERAKLKRRIESDLLRDIEQRYGLQRVRSPIEKDNDALLRALAGAFFIACLGIYLIMAWSLQSFSWPLIVMSVIPLGIGSAVLAHWISGYGFGLFSLFGLLGMIGVIVNDAILYLVRYRELRAQLPLEAAVLQAGNDRFRAICLTTLTTVLGCVPLLLDGSPNAEMFKPLLIGFCGGLLPGPLLLLLVIPSLLLLCERELPGVTSRLRWRRAFSGASLADR